MTLGLEINPYVAIPRRVRMQIICCRIMQFLAASLSDKNSGEYAKLEREFMELVERENATISKICFSYSGSVAEFDDLRQDALVNIWRGMRTFREEASQRTWIYRVTVNSCLSTLRRQARHNHESLEALYSVANGDSAYNDSIEQIHSIISRLKPEEKAIVMMWLDEFSYDEIASSMGMNRNTVATKIRRIKEKITKEYKAL